MIDSLKDERLQTISVVSSHYINTSLKRPFALQDAVFSGNILYINQEYYKMHKEGVDLELSSLFASLKRKEIIVDKNFINQKTANGIAQNPNFTKVDLQYYSLEKNVFDILSQSKSIQEIITSGVEEELANSYDPRITYRMNETVGTGLFRSLKSLLTASYINVNSCDLEEIFEVLKHRNKSLPHSIDVNVNDYTPLASFIKNIDSLYVGVAFKDDPSSPQPGYLTLKIDPLHIDLDSLKEIPESKNIVSHVFIDRETVSLKTAIQIEERIDSLLEPVKAIKDQLSPFELYTKLYEIAKDFKKYQKEEEGMSPMKSRAVSEILFSDYIVCVGYIKLLQTFCDRFGLETNYMSVGVMGEGMKDAHARLFVEMKDEKYGIDGVYVSDPTWDSMGNEKYNHLLMTFDEIAWQRDASNIFDLAFSPYDFLNVKTKKELDEMLQTPTLAQLFRKLPYLLQPIDHGHFIKSCEYDYSLKEEKTKEKLKDFCVSFHQNSVSGDKILASLVHIYQLEHKDATEEEIIDHFRPIREALKERKDRFHPTIETVSKGEKIFEFFDNKYERTNVEKIVKEEVRSAKV